MAKPTIRTIQQINNDYFQKAAMLGDLEWKMSKLLPQIEQIKRELKEIDEEADAYQAREERERQSRIQKAGETNTATNNGATLVPQTPKNEDTTSETAVQ